MGGYVVNFTVYTMAMIGLICFAVFVYKKIMNGELGKKHTNYIEIEDTLNLNPRKTLHVVRAGNEKFLIASDVDRTSLISKLNDNQQLPQQQYYQDNVRQNFNDVMNFVKQQQPTKTIPQQKTKPHVHLEPITRKADRGVGISNLRKSLDYRAGEVNLAPQPQINRTTTPKTQPQAVSQTRQPQRTTSQRVPITPQPVRKTSGSSLRDMAKKINEL